MSFFPSPADLAGILNHWAACPSDGRRYLGSDYGGRLLLAGATAEPWSASRAAEILEAVHRDAFSVQPGTVTAVRWQQGGPVLFTTHAGDVVEVAV